jgi:PLP dependent protein
MNLVALKSNYLQVLDRIEEAAHRAGRDPQSVRLVVVTKTQTIETVRSLISAGAVYLGENYADEAVEKINAVGQDPSLEWHMVGHVQSRKARLVCEHFHYLHSLDRLKLARGLSKCLKEQGRKLPVLLECNTSGEQTKQGWPAWDESRWPELEEPLAEIMQLPELDVRGLMTMAPYFDEQDRARPYFERLRRLADFLRSRFPQSAWQELSMGMSGDFEAAIQEGATWVRIGSAILGDRPVSI